MSIICTTTHIYIVPCKIYKDFYHSIIYIANEGCHIRIEYKFLNLNQHVMGKTYYLVCNQINTMGVTSGARTAYPSGAPGFTPGFQWGSCYSIFSYMYVLQIVVCPFVIFFLAIVLSVLLPYTDSDCPFGIFELFLLSSIIMCTERWKI